MGVSQRAFDALARDWSTAGKGAHAFPVFFGAAPEKIAAICEEGFDAAPRTPAASAPAGGRKAEAPDAGVAAAGAVNPSSPRAEQSGGESSSEDMLRVHKCPGRVVQSLVSPTLDATAACQQVVQVIVARMLPGHQQDTE